MIAIIRQSGDYFNPEYSYFSQNDEFVGQKLLCYIIDVTGDYDDREDIDMPILRNADPKPRYSSPQQAGLKAITDAEAEALTQMADFNTQLGINSDQGAFEASYVHLNSGEKGTPRVFFAVPGQDGVEGIKNLHETGMQNWWGKDFWNQVQMGNVFVYPARSDKPCQLLLGEGRSGQLAAVRQPPAGGRGDTAAGHAEAQRMAAFLEQNLFRFLQGCVPDL